jgi:site-specific recombinase XerD
VERFIHFLELHHLYLGPLNIDRSLLQDYFQGQLDRGLALATMARRCWGLHHFFRWCVEGGLAQARPDGRLSAAQGSPAAAQAP